MSLCINPRCSQPKHPENLHSRYCKSCNSDLLLNNRYRVMRLLSDKSGFGIVYEAYEGGTPKILKVLKDNFNSEPKIVELFQQEAKVLGQFNHPGIPKVDGYFPYQTANNLLLHCIVMEKIEGVNLAQWLEQPGNQRIDQNKALVWLKQLAEILHLVHEKQYFHRDIKPPNIMLKPNGHLVLIDFGTAREATYTYLAKLGAKYQVTAVVCKGYTPPEQINGQAIPQSDFFALGRTFAHLLTGEHPLNFYDGTRDVLDWRSHAPGVSSLLLNLIDEMMAREAGKRPLNAQMLLQRIATVEGKLQSSLRRARKKFDLMAIAVGTATIIGTVVAILAYIDSKQNQSRPPNPPSPPIVSSSPPAPNPLANLSLNQTLSGHSESVNSVAISADGQTVASGSWDNTIKIWELGTGKSLRILIWEIGTGKLLRTLSGHSSSVFSVAISADGQTVASGSKDKTIKIWELKTGELLRTLSGHSDSVISVAISADGQTVTSGSYDNTIKIWELKTGKLLRTLSGHSDFVHSVAISADGQTVASGSGDRTIKIWELKTGKLLRTLSGHSNPVYSVAISADGQTVASASHDQTIKIWELKTGKLLRTLSGHSSSVFSVAISADGQTVASGSGDRTIKIWELKTGKLLRTLSGHSNPVYSVPISADGQTVASGSYDKTIKIWRLQR